MVLEPAVSVLETSLPVPVAAAESSISAVPSPPSPGALTMVVLVGRAGLVVGLIVMIWPAWYAPAVGAVTALTIFEPVLNLPVPPVAALRLPVPDSPARVAVPGQPVPCPPQERL